MARVFLFPTQKDTLIQMFKEKKNVKNNYKRSNSVLDSTLISA